MLEDIPLNWKQNACRIAAAFGASHLSFAGRGDTMRALFCFDDVDWVFAFNWKEFVSEKTGIAKYRRLNDVAFDRGDKRAADVKAILAKERIGANASAERREFEFDHGGRVPEQTAHEQLESHLEFVERYKKFCRENRVAFQLREVGVK